MHHVIVSDLRKTNTHTHTHSEQKTTSGAGEVFSGCWCAVNTLRQCTTSRAAVSNSGRSSCPDETGTTAGRSPGHILDSSSLAEYAENPVFEPKCSDETRKLHICQFKRTVVTKAALVTCQIRKVQQGEEHRHVSFFTFSAGTSNNFFVAPSNKKNIFSQICRRGEMRSSYLGHGEHRSVGSANMKMDN